VRCARYLSVSESEFNAWTLRRRYLVLDELTTLLEAENATGRTDDRKG
jgi:hypothetical protein